MRFLVRLLAVIFSAPIVILSAQAEAQHSDPVQFLLEPGEAKIIFASTRPEASALPAFKICMSSPKGFAAKVHAGRNKAGSVLGQLKGSFLPDCMFASAPSITIILDAEPSSEPNVEGKNDATSKAISWLEERVETLRAKPDRDETDEALLQEFEARLSAAEEADRVIATIHRSELDNQAARVTVTPVTF